MRPDLARSSSTCAGVCGFLHGPRNRHHVKNHILRHKCSRRPRSYTNRPFTHASLTHAAIPSHARTTSCLNADMLFQCIACETSFVRSPAFPFCRECETYLRDRPCVSILQPTDPIARYNLTTRVHRILKAWKKNLSLETSRTVFQAPPTWWKSVCAQNAEAVTWVPQSERRIERLGGSSSYEVAAWIAAELGLPLIETLQTQSRSGGRQAQRPIHGRWSDPPLFVLSPHCDQTTRRRWIITDDFSISGATLASACETLQDLETGITTTVVLGRRLIDLN